MAGNYETGPGQPVESSYAPTRAYEKPVITKCGEMTFPADIIDAVSGGVSCRQCSSCHGCR